MKQTTPHASSKQEEKSEPRPSFVKIWVTAARPHTLTASLSPCLIAYHATRPPSHLMLAWTIFCLTIQIGTNLHNDYADFVQGADTVKRLGQARATAQGWLTPFTTCVAATSVLSVTFLSGCYLLTVTGQLQNWMAWFLVISSVFNAFAYTGGPYPLGYLGLPSHWSIAYAGLGEVFVLLYFGLVAVLMLPYLLSCQGTPIDWLSQCIYGVQVGLLSTKIIVVNNLRDRHTDVSAGKRTTAVRFGRRYCEVEYMVCDMLAYGLVVVEFLSRNRPVLRLLPFLSLPLTFKETRAVLQKDGGALNAHVGGAAKVQLAFCILQSIGLALS